MAALLLFMAYIFVSKNRAFLPASLTLSLVTHNLQGIGYYECTRTTIIVRNA